MSKKDKKDKKFQGLIFIILGLSLILIFALWRIYEEWVLSFTKKYPAISEVSKGFPPKKIFIPPLKINLDIEKGKIINGVREISQNGASHLDVSKNPGEKGNIIIYAHNKNNLFGPIRWIKVGDGVDVITEDGEIHKYKVDKTPIVNPGEIEYVLPKQE